MEPNITITNEDLREQRAVILIYEDVDFSQPEIAHALLKGRLDDLSALEFDGYFQGRMCLGKPEEAKNYIYHGAAGTPAYLDHGQAIALISAHTGKITVRL